MELHIRAIEQELRLLADLRGLAKTDGGRLTEFGRSLVAAAKTSGIKQKVIAAILDVSPAAISFQYAKTNER